MSFSGREARTHERLQARVQANVPLFLEPGERFVACIYLTTASLYFHLALLGPFGSITTYLRARWLVLTDRRVLCIRPAAMRALTMRTVLRRVDWSAAPSEVTLTVADRGGLNVLVGTLRGPAGEDTIRVLRPWYEDARTIAATLAAVPRSIPPGPT